MASTLAPTDLWPPPVPTTRFLPWAELYSGLQTIAMRDLDYDALTWDLPGSNEDIELQSYESLNKEEQQAAGALSLDEDSWDCWVNHFHDYDWDELVLDNMDTCYQALGWTEDLWEEDDEDLLPATETKKWFELTIEEREAAECLCFFEDLWNGDLALDQYTTIPLN